MTSCRRTRRPAHGQLQSLRCARFQNSASRGAPDHRSGPGALTNAVGDARHPQPRPPQVAPLRSIAAACSVTRATARRRSTPHRNVWASSAPVSSSSERRRVVLRFASTSASQRRCTEPYQASSTCRPGGRGTLANPGRSRLQPSRPALAIADRLNVRNDIESALTTRERYMRSAQDFQAIIARSAEPTVRSHSSRACHLWAARRSRADSTLDSLFLTREQLEELTDTSPQRPSAPLARARRHRLPHPPRWPPWSCSSTSCDRNRASASPAELCGTRYADQAHAQGEPAQDESSPAAADVNTTGTAATSSSITSVKWMNLGRDYPEALRSSPT